MNLARVAASTALALALALALAPFAARAQSNAHAPPAAPPFARSARARPWRYIVVHHSATPGGSVRAFEAYHRGVRRMPRGMAYHFVIGNGRRAADGAMEAGARWLHQLPGAHVASALRDPETGVPMDDVAIGICLVGDLETGPPTRAQRRALARLIVSLRRSYGIPARRVLSHGEVRGAHTACPGRNLPLRESRVAE